MSQLPRYESYKDSGVQWLGEIPSHWGVMRLKNSIVSAQNGVWGDEPKSDENDLYCLRVADFDRRLLTMSTDNLTIRNISEKDYLVRRLAVGDLLLEKSGGGDKQPVGFVVQNNFTQKAVCSNFVAKVVLKHNMDSRYWTYHHQVLYNARVNTRSIKQSTGIQNLDATLYFNELACFPPIEEQILIALFLDKRLAQVDALIAKQETLLEKLAEQRVALISHAVTKGLNPDVEMRLSRVDELGQIPNHWIETRLKFMAKIQNGCDYKHVQAEDGYPVIGSGGQFTYATEFLYQGESVLFGRKGTIDKPLYINDAFWTVDTMYYTEILENTFPKFLYYCALTIDFWKYSTQTALPSMTQTVLSNLYFSIPEYDEQKQIAKYLDQKTEELDNQYAKVVEIREKLKEYRSTLITQVVTGKIDVRNLKVN